MWLSVCRLARQEAGPYVGPRMCSSFCGKRFFSCSRNNSAFAFRQESCKFYLTNTSRISAKPPLDISQRFPSHLTQFCRTLASHSSCLSSPPLHSSFKQERKNLLQLRIPSYVHSLQPYSSDDNDDRNKPQTLMQRFKRLWKQYWYIVVPVHFGSYALWIGGFYCASKYGLDLAAMLESVPMIPESWVEKTRNAPTAAGHIAIAYFMCKIISPVRYMFTIGGTTLSIRVLSHFGLIRTSSEIRDDLAEYWKDRRENFEERRKVYSFALQKRFQKRNGNGNGSRKNGKNGHWRKHR